MIKKYYSLLLIVALLLFVGFWHKELLGDRLLESDDYQHHAVRTANYYLALRQGQFPVRWAPNLNEGYGYPAFNYMYPLPYMVSSFFHFAGASVQQSVNLAMLSAALLATTTSYLLIKYLTKNNLAAITGAAIYTLSPYPLLNIFWRGAIGEVFFVAFVPLLLLSLIIFFKSRIPRLKKIGLLLTSLSIALLILSHFPSLTLLFPITLLLIMALVFFDKKKDSIKTFSAVCVAGLLGILMSAWYWLPAFLEKNLITYETGTSLTQYQSHFVSLISLFDIRRTIQSSEYFVEVTQIGAAGLLIAVLTIFTLYKTLKTKQNLSKKIFIVWSLLVFLISIILMIPLSRSLWDNFKIFQLVQYPWRILWMSMLAVVVMFASLISNFSKIQQLLITLAIFVLVFWSAVTYTQPKGYFSRADFDWYEMGTTGSSFDEHQPIWSQKPYYFPEELMYVDVSRLPLLAESESKDQLSNIVLPLSELDPNIQRLDGTKVMYQLENEQKILVLHKRLFFPGWTVAVNEAPAKPLIDVSRYEGIMAVKLPTGANNVSVQFTGRTKIRLTGEIISIISILIFGITSALPAKLFVKKLSK
jgi:hypothetical protein